MTVPGKGGRPRKWRSDADRVRAYQARQTGGDEPPVLAQALDDGDDLARVWAMVRDLGERLATPTPRSNSSAVNAIRPAENSNASNTAGAGSKPTTPN